MSTSARSLATSLTAFLPGRVIIASFAKKTTLTVIIIAFWRRGWVTGLLLGFCYRTTHFSVRTLLFSDFWENLSVCLCYLSEARVYLFAYLFYYLVREKMGREVGEEERGERQLARGA